MDFETGLTTVLIGTGDYGQLILNGIRLDDTALILEGTVLAALLGILVQGLFDPADRLLFPLGLRIHSEGAATK